MRRAIAIAAAAALAGGGCGEDEEPSLGGPGDTTATETATTAAPTATAPSATAPPETVSPEEQPGGAGDEEEARSPAFFTGKGGRITPRVVRVPPFLAIRVELRSVDGRHYGLRFGGRELRAGDRKPRNSIQLDGLRPQKAIVGTPIGAGSRVRIVADAEPGP